MATKKSTEFVCQNCNYTSPKWLGKCPGCNEYNTFEEQKIQISLPTTSTNRFSMTKVSGEIVDLSEVNTIDYPRIETGINELDSVLGGGIVPGSVILIGGEPGIGKSTLLIQTSEKMKDLDQRVLYISGEESTQQIALRAKRLELKVQGIKMLSETELEKIISTFEIQKPKFVIIDSIQTIFSNQLTSAPGSISQIKDCAARLARYAKESGTTMVLIGHVTKDGDLAGPRVLEHIVDTVLYFEGEKDNTIRMLRAFKNRFGNVNEIGLFAMGGRGLEEIREIGTMFTSNKNNVPGSCAFMTQEGNRPILVEIQALLDQTQANIPIKSAVGFDQKRLSMIMAVINKFLGHSVYGYNVFVSLIGGMKTQDPCADLPVFLAMMSSLKEKPLPSNLAAFGEIGLTGELRANYNFESRIKEASRLGITTMILAPIDIKKKIEIEKKYNVELVECDNIQAVLKYLKQYL